MRAAWLVASAVLVGVAGYAARPVAIGSIHFYQRHLSSVAEHMGARCRFTPSCSRYAEVVIARDGLVHGGWKALQRVARCGPWTTAGTRDDP